MRVLTRKPDRARGQLPYRGVEFYSLSQLQQALTGATGVVNLAGILLDGTILDYQSALNFTCGSNLRRSWLCQSALHMQKESAVYLECFHTCSYSHGPGMTCCSQAVSFVRLSTIHSVCPWLVGPAIWQPTKLNLLVLGH